jgi:hypothetical protein
MDSVFALDDDACMVAQQGHSFALEQRQILLGLLCADLHISCLDGHERSTQKSTNRKNLFHVNDYLVYFWDKGTTFFAYVQIIHYLCSDLKI